MPTTCFHCVQARVLAYDGGVPSLSATAVVTINVLRNLFPPLISNTDFLRLTIPETTPVGTVIVQINATDRDTTVSVCVCVCVFACVCVSVCVCLCVCVCGEHPEHSSVIHTKALKMPVFPLFVCSPPRTR